MYSNSYKEVLITYYLCMISKINPHKMYIIVTLVVLALIGVNIVHASSKPKIIYWNSSGTPTVH